MKRPAERLLARRRIRGRRRRPMQAAPSKPRRHQPPPRPRRRRGSRAPASCSRRSGEGPPRDPVGVDQARLQMRPRVHGSSYFCFEAPGHYPCVYDIIGERRVQGARRRPSAKLVAHALPSWRSSCTSKERSRAAPRCASSRPGTGQPTLVRSQGRSPARSRRCRRRRERRRRARRRRSARRRPSRRPSTAVRREEMGANDRALRDTSSCAAMTWTATDAPRRTTPTGRKWLRLAGSARDRSAAGIKELQAKVSAK